MLVTNALDKQSKLEKLYNTYCDEVYACAYNIMKNRAEAENIVHDTFVTLYRYLDSVETEPSPKTWKYIKTIVCRKAYTAYKQRKRESIVEPAVLEEMRFGQDDPVEYVEKKRMQNELMDLVKELPDSYKEVLYLQYFAQMRGEEIAEILDKTVENVWQIATRARNKLKKELQKRGY